MRKILLLLTASFMLICCGTLKDKPKCNNCYVVTKVKKKENSTWFIYVKRNDSIKIIASTFNPEIPKNKLTKAKKGLTFEGELIYWDIRLQQQLGITPLREHYFEMAIRTKPFCDMGSLNLQYCSKFNGKYFIKE